MAFLNRWRGSDILDFLPSIIIPAFLAFLAGSYLSFFVFAALYIFGESWGWGKWVGYLCHEEGKQIGFKQCPELGIDRLANFIISEKKDYYKHCLVALFIRGLWWWLPICIAFSFFGFNLIACIIGGICLGILFPISCRIGKYLENFCMNYSAWELQEYVYGFFHGLVLLLISTM